MRERARIFAISLLWTCFVWQTTWSLKTIAYHADRRKHSTWVLLQGGVFETSALQAIRHDSRTGPDFTQVNNVPFFSPDLQNKKNTNLTTAPNQSSPASEAPYEPPTGLGPCRWQRIFGLWQPNPSRLTGTFPGISTACGRKPTFSRARRRHINFEHINFLKVGTTLGQPAG